MKKFIGGIAVGWALNNLYYAYKTGVFSRTVTLFKQRREADAEVIPSKDEFLDMVEYITQQPFPGRQPKPVATPSEEEKRENLQRWTELIRQGQAMRAEGYSNAEIAQAQNLSEDLIDIIQIVSTLTEGMIRAEEEEVE